jgi:hypothetical protein
MAFKTLALVAAATCAILAAPALADRTHNPPTQLNAQEASIYASLINHGTFGVLNQQLGEVAAKRTMACTAIRTQTPVAHQLGDSLSAADADKFVIAIMQHCVADVLDGSCGANNPYNKSDNPFPEVGPDPLPRKSCP